MSKVQLTVRIEENLLDKLKAISDKEMRSINSQYEYFLAKSVDDYEKQNGIILIPDEQ